MRLFVWLVFIVFAVTLINVFLVNPIVIGYCTTKVHSLTVSAVNIAIGKSMSRAEYSDFTVINRDANGQIQSVTTNVEKINAISGNIATNSQQQIENFSHKGLAVPLGTFSGLPILVGRGIDINLRLIPVGSVLCNFQTDFVSGGINQTVHRIVLYTNSIVNLVMPLGLRTIHVAVEVLLCENLIVGTVPPFFMSR